MSSNRTYYQILGITPEANDREIKRAYHRLARTMHPDKASTSEEARKMESEFAPVSRAYNILKDKQKRQEYDEQLSRSAGTASAASSAADRVETSSADAALPQAIRRADQKSTSARSAIARKAFTKGMQLYNSGDFVKAVEFFEAAINNDNSEAIYFARLAKALMNARRSFTKAREMALKAIEMDPYNTDYRMVLGEICEIAGSHSLAIQAYKDVLRWDAENQRALNRLNALEKEMQPSLFSKLLSRFKK